MSKDLTATIELVKRAQGGDRESRERLINRYYDRVRRIVRIRMDSKLRRRLDTGDILQETFVSAMSAFDRFDMATESSFINWLAVIAEHKIRDAMDHAGAQRRDARREVSMVGGTGKDPDEEQNLAEVLPEEAPSPLTRMQIKEASTQLEDAIHDLPEQYREVILLRDYSGCSWDEIAKETGRPTESAARMVHARAMVALSKRMQTDG